ncbi:hypothetical protein ABE65_008025 [Fictibacillus phosphorivorans]|uniref:Uncharacterized protein n=2 Tax=Fictibacillus phosphorivorans TaxID=1221500 RepID=A0A160IS15_9BACL|nr:hypothetical protein ABE65_008025 [Fictibacillus phosphorivorans]
MNQDPTINHVDKKMMAGIPFIYVTVSSQYTIEQSTDSVKKHAVKAMKGKRLTLNLTFVRSEDNLRVYRMRFLVPQEKMFCCGNLCFDCIRFKD